MGSWGYVQPRIATALKELNGKEAKYVGRNAAASPATGTPAIHKAEVAHIMTDAFSVTHEHEKWEWKISELMKKVTS